MTTTGMRQAWNVERSVRDEALDRILAKEEAIIEAERLAALEDAKPALIATVQEAADGVHFNDELAECQRTVEERFNALTSALSAMQTVRKDDDRARRAYKSACNAALKAGVSQADLPAIPDPVSKMSDIAPGIGEGGWGRRWTGGA
jgi:hypothetical protein